MLTGKDLFAIPYYEANAIFTGSQRDFRFRIEKAVPEDKAMLKLTFYPEGKAFEFSREEDREESFFEYSPEGLEEIARVINERP